MPLKSTMVKDYMSKTLVTFKPEMSVLDAVHTLVEHRIAGAPVVDDDGLDALVSHDRAAVFDDTVQGVDRRVAEHFGGSQCFGSLIYRGGSSGLQYPSFVQDHDIAAQHQGLGRFRGGVDHDCLSLPEDLLQLHAQLLAKLRIQV